jgi:hypothetical protein
MDTKLLLGTPLEKRSLRKIAIHISEKYRRELSIYKFCGVTLTSLDEWVQTFRRKAVTSSSRANSSKRNLLGLHLAIKVKALRSLGTWGASDVMT